MRRGLRWLAFASGVAVAGCHGREPAPLSAARARFQPPDRRAGLWEQVMTRDGSPPPLVGKVRLCLDKATEAGLSPFGARLRGRACPERSVTRATDGAYLFSSRCELGQAGLTTASGRLVRPSATAYEAHEESVTRGAVMEQLNGRHVVDIKAVWLGPCPAGMAPGDLVLNGGLKINLAKAAAASALLGGG